MLSATQEPAHNTPNDRMRLTICLYGSKRERSSGPECLALLNKCSLTQSGCHFVTCPEDAVTNWRSGCVCGVLVQVNVVYAKVFLLPIPTHTHQNTRDVNPSNKLCANRRRKATQLPLLLQFLFFPPPPLTSSLLFPSPHPRSPPPSSSLPPTPAHLLPPLPFPPPPLTSSLLFPSPHPRSPPPSSSLPPTPAHLLPPLPFPPPPLTSSLLSLPPTPAHLLPSLPFVSPPLTHFPVLLDNT